MPICTIHLLSLKPSTTIPTFLNRLSSTGLKPLTISRVIRWIILPTKLSTSSLLARNIHWDLLLILPSDSSLPSSLLSHIAHKWSVRAGVPSRLLQDFHTKNACLLHPNKNDVPPLTGALNRPRIANSSQDLEMSSELREWIENEFGKSEIGKGAMSMLNLLAFNEGMKEEYLKYGAEFAKSIGSKRGGNAKIVGTVINDEGKDKGLGGRDEGEGWDEVALAHYPSIWHFADMLASEDYQKVNHQHRVGSLRDTFILCTSELSLEDGGRARL